MSDAPINRCEFYRRPEDRDEFFGRILQQVGRPPFARRAPLPPRFLSRRAPAQQPYSPAVVRLPAVTRSDQ